MPWNRWSYLAIMLFIACCSGVVVVDLIVLGFSFSIRIAFWLVSPPSGCIFIIPSSMRVSLLRSGGEFILPFTTTNVAGFPQVSLRMIVSNFPLTLRGCCNVLSLIWQCSNVSLWLVRCSNCLELMFVHQVDFSPTVWFHPNIYVI